MSWRTRLLSFPGWLGGLGEGDVAPDPFLQFERWFRFAKQAGCYTPEAMSLATTTLDGRPSLRIMLLKGVHDSSFVFYTNYESRKGNELTTNPHAAIALHWVELWRQVRAEGKVVSLSSQESDAYFATRPRASRIGAWASRQSTELPDRAALERRVIESEAKFRGREVPRPLFWGGYRLIPERIEFWQGRRNRLHDRLCFLRQPNGWRLVRLSP